MLYQDVMVSVGDIRMVKVIPSKNECPFCGGNKWFAYTIQDEEVIPASGVTALVDVSPNWWGFSHSNHCSNLDIDECVGCKAVCSM